MPADLGNAYVNIVPKAPGIEGKIDGLVSGGGQKAGVSLGKSMLRGLATVGITAAVGKILKDAFEEGAKLQQSFGGLETIYGEEAAAQAKAYAKEAAKAGISANKYAEQAVSVGAALKAAYNNDTQAAMEAANTAILDMADNSAKMGTDIASVQAAYQGFARGQYQLLDNLKLGYGGTKTEMERLLADAQEISGIEYNIDNLGDVYDAIHVIQGELGLTGVAAEEAKTTFSGSAASMKASWENLMGALTTGEGLSEAMTNLTESVGNFASNVLKMLGELGPQLPGMILGLVDIIIEQLPAFASAGAEMVAKLLVGLVNAFPSLLKQVPVMFKEIKNAFANVDWGSLGKAIIDGIIDGLKSAANALYAQIQRIGQEALQTGRESWDVGSPSRVAADEIGRWIPPGIAMGIEDNMAPLNRAMSELANVSAFEIQKAPATAAPDRASEPERPVNVTVMLQGDAGKIFKVVNDHNYKRTKATSYNVLAAGV